MGKSKVIAGWVMTSVGLATMIVAIIRHDIDLSMMGMLTLIYAKQIEGSKP